MDKLISYIEQRIKKYGHVTGGQGISSNYYTFGNFVVRVSDHIKYGESSVKKFDYSFIIQPNDTYIFTSSPKNDSQSTRMYVKIITLKDAKEFIRRLHDFSISLSLISEIYSTYGWNSETPKLEEKPNWDKFYNEYIINLDDNLKLAALDMIELTVSGFVGKGNLDVKLERIPNVYENASIIQYDTIIHKIEKNKKLNI